MPSRAVNAIRGGLEAVERLSGHARGSSAASRSQRRQAHADRVKPPRARGEETVEQVAPWQARSGEGVVSDGPSRMRTPGEPGADERARETCARASCGELRRWRRCNWGARIVGGIRSQCWASSCQERAPVQYAQVLGEPRCHSPLRTRVGAEEDEDVLRLARTSFDLSLPRTRERRACQGGVCGVCGEADCAAIRADEGRVCEP